MNPAKEQKKHFSTVNGLNLRRVVKDENILSAASLVSDFDITMELTEFVRSQILSQAAVGRIAQGPCASRMCLQLLGKRPGSA